MNEELKPCAHCGGTDIHIDENIDTWCADCGATAPSEYWNRRAPIVVTDAMVADIKRAVTWGTEKIIRATIEAAMKDVGK